MLVNKNNPLPEDYVPSGLIPVKIPFVQPVEFPKTCMTWQAAQAVCRMVREAGLDGIEILGISAYRSYKTQENIFIRSALKNGIEHAVRYVALPGQSEHQTGLAIDIGCAENNYELEESFADTRCFNWLTRNAYLYGLIIRYPKGKEAITGYYFEPWHLRYVGVELAKVVQDTEKCLEEILEK